ncbi:leucine-rich repeat protein [Eubacterium xylanophilum]|uniref:leucine-rich repeat protein n=1 Tax=Eubacterium xylanophilum TaxID=39497 RepID=UPI000479401D|nr:leucine-rich repeat domain-containing protein [Eubacterium xylanophilum]
MSRKFKIVVDTWILFMLIVFGYVFFAMDSRAAVIAGGGLGKSMSWEVDQDGILRIAGEGEFPDIGEGNAPWANYSIYISKVEFDINGKCSGNINGYFKGLINLSSVLGVPEGIDSMVGTFSGDTNLTYIDKIPEGVKSLDRCFYKCSRFNMNLNIPDSVESCNSTFENCASLVRIPKFGDDSQLKYASSMYKGTGVTTVNKALPNSVIDMSSCFESCKSLVKLGIIPEKVEDMSRCFYRCDKLERVGELPWTVKNMSYAFYECKALLEAPDIPGSVDNIAYCMTGCSKVSGKIDIYATIRKPEKYKCFACDSSVYQVENNSSLLGGQGSGLKVNYIKNNAGLVLLYISEGWNCGELSVIGKFGPLRLGEKNTMDIAKCKVEDIPAYSYDGLEKCPLLHVWYGNVELIEGRDYELEYKNNIDAGQAEVIISGKGDYVGKKNVLFNIDIIDFSAIDIHTYSGDYDGEFHTIEIETDVPGTKIYYGLDSENVVLEEAPKFLLPGEYEVFYRIEKDNYTPIVGSEKVFITYPMPQYIDEEENLDSPENTALPSETEEPVELDKPEESEKPVELDKPEESEEPSVETQDIISEDKQVAEPTAVPSEVPSAVPTEVTTPVPSAVPTVEDKLPTISPTAVPTVAPTPKIAQATTAKPTETVLPTKTGKREDNPVEKQIKEDKASISQIIKQIGVEEAAKPSQVKNVVVTKKKSSKIHIRFKWKKIKRAKGYQLRWSSSKKLKGKVYKKKVKKNTALISWKRGKRCYFQVRAYKKVKNKIIYGKWSRKKSYVRKG